MLVQINAAVSTIMIALVPPAIRLAQGRFRETADPALPGFRNGDATVDIVAKL